MPLHTNQSNQSTDSNKPVKLIKPNKPASRFKATKTIKPVKPVKPVKSLLVTHLQVKGLRPSLNRKWTQPTNLVVTDSGLKFFSSAD